MFEPSGSNGVNGVPSRPWVEGLRVSVRDTTLRLFAYESRSLSHASAAAPELARSFPVLV